MNKRATAPRGAIPELEHGSGSWMCTPPGGQAMETFTRATAEILAGAGWHVETAGQYLGRINREIREARK